MKRKAFILKLAEDWVFCNHHGKYCEPIRWCQNEDDEDDEYAYPSKAEIDKMRAEYLREKDNQHIDDRRETLLEQADYLKKQQREN